jgi:hypothetical protein
MSPTPLTLDPAVEEVLSDIARQGKSKLLLAEPRDFVLGWLRSGVQIGRNAPGLSNAERHLLDVHREEVARLLLERAIHELESDPACTVGYRPLALSPDEVFRRIAQLPRVQEDTDPSTAVAVASLSLGRPSARAMDSRTTRRALLAASLRVLDREGTRVWIAYDQIARNEPRSAIHSADFVVHAGAPPAVLHTAWQAASVALDQLGHRASSIAGHVLAYELATAAKLPAPECVPPIVNVLLDAVYLADGFRARNWADRLDGLIQRSDPVILRLCQMHRIRRAASPSAPILGRQALALAREIAENYDRASAEVCRALL